MRLFRPTTELIEPKDYEASVAGRERALKMYQRALGYCLRRVELTYKGFLASVEKDPVGTMKAFSRRKCRCSIGPARPGERSSRRIREARVAQSAADRPRDHGPRARTRRSGELGAIHDVLISLDSLPEAMGGSVKDARLHYALGGALERGIGQSARSLASGISVAEQNRKEFEDLLAKALAIDVDQVPACGCQTSSINGKPARFWRARTICSRQTSLRSCRPRSSD